MNKDDRLLGEAYEEMNEGFMDQIKARRAGKQAFGDAGGKSGIGGLMQKGKRGIINKLGGTVDRKETAQMDKADNARSSASADHVSNAYVAKLKELSAKFQQDLAKVTGIDDLGSMNNPELQEIITAIDALNAGE